MRTQVLPERGCRRAARGSASANACGPSSAQQGGLRVQRWPKLQEKARAGASCSPGGRAAPSSCRPPPQSRGPRARRAQRRSGWPSAWPERTCAGAAPWHAFPSASKASPHTSPVSPMVLMARPCTAVVRSAILPAPLPDALVHVLQHDGGEARADARVVAVREHVRLRGRASQHRRSSHVQGEGARTQGGTKPPGDRLAPRACRRLPGAASPESPEREVPGCLARCRPARPRAHGRGARFRQRCGAAPAVGAGRPREPQILLPTEALQPPNAAHSACACLAVQQYRGGRSSA